jgi:hypothetical protein
MLWGLRQRCPEVPSNAAAEPYIAAHMGSPLTTAQGDIFRFTSGADPMSAIL